MATSAIPTTIPATPELSRAYKVRAAALDMRKCERSLAWFVRRAWPRYETAPFLDNWHIDLVCDHVQACYRRQNQTADRELPAAYDEERDRDCVCSLLVVYARPGERFVFASYSSDLSKDHSMAHRAPSVSDLANRGLVWATQAVRSAGARPRRLDKKEVDAWSTP